ncbi:MAG: EamA family transporter [Chloroflexi bacterium]|nr:EamA family transporter [Chloroflexota bacterium]
MTRLGRGEAYAALAAMCFGSAYVATAFALRTFEPLPAAVDRSVLAALALAVVVLLQRSGGRPAMPPPDRPRLAVRAAHLLVLGALGGAIFLTGMNLAVAGVGPTIASFVAGLYAVLAAAFAPFLLREPLRRRTLIGFVTALLGTALLAELHLGDATAAGIGWGLVAAVSFALFLVLSRKWGRADGLDGIRIALAAMAVATVALALLVLAVEPASLALPPLSMEAVGAMGWLAFAGAAGQALGAASMRLVPASRSAAFLLLNPITAAILAFLLLGSVPSPIQLIGAGLVLAGIATATISSSAAGPGDRPAAPQDPRVIVPAA